MKQSDFCQLIVTPSIYKILRRGYRFHGNRQTSRVCKYSLVRSPRSIDPGGISPTSRLRSVLAACGMKDYLGFRSICLTGLNRFTVSHCGSRTPLPTLKPHLAAPAPRLSTGCSLRFAGQGLSPRCLTCTEPAHPPRVLYSKRPWAPTVLKAMAVMLI